MAVFTKTLRYNLNPAGTSGLVTNNTPTVFGSTTVYIPEYEVANPTRIVSALVYVTQNDTSTVTGATISNFQISASVNNAAATMKADANTITNTGENWGRLAGPYDFTSHFSTNWGTADSASVRVTARTNVSTGTGTDTIGHCCWLDLTYEYSSSATNRGQTVCIPLPKENVGSLPTVQGRFCTIPQVSGSGGLFQNYNSFTVLNSYIELRGNVCANNVVTDTALAYTFNSNATPNALPTRENALASDTYSTSIITYPAVSCSAANTFELWSNVATRYTNHSAFLWVTGEYIPSGMTTHLNYIQLPFQYVGPLAGTTSVNSQRITKILRIPEPAPITFKHCAIDLSYTTNASTTLNIKAFGQSSYQAYAQSLTQVSGQISALHHVSSSQLTLVSGSNTLNIDAYRSVGSVTNLTGVVHLLYESNIYVSGSDYHSKMVSELFREITNSTTTDTTVTTSFPIAESDYYIHGANLKLNLPTALGANHITTVQARQGTDENNGDDWVTLYVDQSATDAEFLGYYIINVDGDKFQRNRNDIISNRLSITGSRSYRVTNSTAGRFGGTFDVSYHACTYQISGYVTGSAGKVDLDLLRATDDAAEIVEHTSIIGDGNYSFTIYNPGEYYYVVASMGSRVAGSKYGFYGDDFNISFITGSSSPTGSSSSEHSYTWIG